jgi:hypothetical protein
MGTPDPDTRDDLTDLERRLAGWQPASDRLDRDRMLFDAGRASARSEIRERAWAACSAILLLVSAGLGVQLVREHARREGLERTHATRSQPESPPRTLPPPEIVPAPDSYLVLTHRLVAGLGDPPPPPSTQHQEAPEGRDSPLSPLRVRGLGETRDL